MADEKIKRSLIKSFLNTTPSTTATYALIGPGAVTGKVDMNPDTTKETYIHEDTASISVDSYAPVMKVELTAIKGDDVFTFVDDLRKKRAVLGDAETDVVHVYLYETATAGAYPAEKQGCSIQIDDFGGDGGKPTKINFTVNYVGDPVKGKFDPETLAFTPDA